MARKSPLRPPDPGGVPSVRRFLLVFALVFLVLEVLVRFVLYRNAVFAPFAALNGKICAVLLDLFMENVASRGSILSAGGFTIDIRPGCDSLQASAVLLAGIAAFPATWKQRAIGAAIGLAFLFVLNLARLITMLLVGLHNRPLFDTMHLEIMPAVFVLAALVAWIVWALKVSGPAQAPDPGTG